MSATLSEIEKIQNWINAEIFECKFRPVPLSEHILSESKLVNSNNQLLIDLKQITNIKITNSKLDKKF